MKALDLFIQRMMRTIRTRRRGTVLVLALGVLAILSVAALSYVAVVRLDRQNVVVVGERENYQPQVNIVVDHMGGLLAADLFGNKIVTPSTPVSSGTARLWPSMFEDGEWRDAPSFDESTFGLDIAQTARAVPDDAFLASTEPRWDVNDLENTTTWPQITNLRSGYTYNAEAQKWIRGDGKFADLASWFLAATQETDGYADPYVELLDWTNINVVRIGPEYGRDQGVFDKQANDLSFSTTPIYGPIKPSDERQWVDTDGDLRPDARWTVLEQLNRSSNLKWVVAARIIDASGLVNVNSAIEFGGSGSTYPTDVSVLGAGRTPADIDLPRLLENLRQDTTGDIYAFPREVRVDRLFGGAFEAHLLDGLGMEEVIADVITEGWSPAPTALSEWTPISPTTRPQRRYFWNAFGQDALSRSAVGRRGIGYSVREAIDLFSFWGVNDPGRVSRIEQAFDGTEALGYLPNNTDAVYGPMRSKEDGTARRWYDPSGGVSLGLPTRTQIHNSARRFLTPVSGVGTQSPVPVLNSAPEYAGKYRTEKVRIDALPDASAPDFKKKLEERIRSVFQALVWALAPTATDQSLAAGMTAGQASEDAHYGGYVSDPAETGPGYRSLARHLYPPDTDYDGDGDVDFEKPFASFAAITAASMAVNFVDAIDAESPTGPNANMEKPTVATFYNNSEPPIPAAFSTPSIGTRLAQGDLPAAVVPWVDGTSPYLIVGLDRQPFLREISVIAIYSDATVDGVGDEDSLTGPDEPNEALGSAVRVVLSNPWRQAIRIGPQYNVVIPETVDNDPATADFIDDPDTDPLADPRSGPFRMILPDTTIEPGKSACFLWILKEGGADSGPAGDAWNAIREKILEYSDFEPVGEPPEGGGDVILVSDANILPSATDFSDPSHRVPFARLLTFECTGPSCRVQRGALLTYVDQTTGSTMPELVVDRLRPNSEFGFPEFKSSLFDFTNTDPGSPTHSIVDNLPTVGFAPSNIYFLGLGWPMQELNDDPRWNGGVAPQLTGRVLHSACLSRPTGRRSQGMSAVAIEDRSRNETTRRQDAVAWFIGSGAAYQEAWIRDDPRSIVFDISQGQATGIEFPDHHVRGFLEGDLTFADQDLPYGVAEVDLPVFQFFVPDGGLVVPSDMLRITTFAHTCKDCGDVNTAGDLRHWRTVSEKLGATLNYFHGDTTMTAVPNPYLGVLDPTRYVPGGDLVDVAPDTMKIPLALRVPDCFEAGAVVGPLVQGRVNINTAPAEVLAALPLVAPVAAIPAPAAPPPPLIASAGISAGSDPPSTSPRVQSILTYRDPGLGGRPGLTGFNMPPGLRPGSGEEANAGFATPAELAVLGNWDVANGSPVAGQPGTFLELGADGAPNDFSPLQLPAYAEANALVNPIDDPEERLALYRAVSNIATTRSDVFIAWFVLRGYDPRTIENIRVGSGSSIDVVLAAMDAPESEFQPVHESRWLVIYDRSQTEAGHPLDQPTLRPRVLLKAQLPSAKP